MNPVQLDKILNTEKTSSPRNKQYCAINALILVYKLLKTIYGENYLYLKITTINNNNIHFFLYCSPFPALAR